MHTIDTKPPIKPLFETRSFRAVLDDSQARAIRQARRLKTVADDTVTRIVTAHDVALPLIDWESPSIEIAATSLQTLRAVTRWPVSGPAVGLTWVPRTRSITSPPCEVGQIGPEVLAIAEGATLADGDITAANTHARRHIDKHLSALWEERAEWRPHYVRAVTEAVRLRAALLNAADLLEEGV